MQHIKETNSILAINGDQNMFVYDIEARDKEFARLTLARSHCLYLDEIIDIRFMSSNKHAVMCSNSESLKLMDLETGNTEIQAGHTDIIMSVDRYKDFILTGAKDNTCRLWKYDATRQPFDRIKCVAVFKGHAMSITSVSFSPKKGYQFVSSSEDNTIKVWNVKQLIFQAD